ncbi:protein N-lysine methyltransferase METTL21A-like protein [Carex littledalei]|uniref:Protein N-lysine methyltransferase METTL21A-like protein n=1 Tax=Carex littledalei TaxID=544730 RepID=A0A833V4K8_9POAL|nr:protein N-lysine methyltransferase METTL21A-like protein [Carex littledalei]
MGMIEVVIGDMRLTIYERNDTQDPVTGRAITRSWLWESAVYLSEWISEALVANRVTIYGSTVLELGAGTGLPGLFTAAKGASRVILTDVGSLVPSLCANMEANGLEDLVQVII